MIIIGTSTFTVGKFTVQQRPRFDNPAFAVYIVMLAGEFIGKQFSMPSITDCQWLQRENSPNVTDITSKRAIQINGATPADERRLRAGQAPASHRGRPKRAA